VVTLDDGRTKTFYGTTPLEAEKRARSFVLEPGYGVWRDLHHKPREPL
jgi:hypothetical protein